jgi:hypothetical protein
MDRRTVHRPGGTGNPDRSNIMSKTKQITAENFPAAFAAMDEAAKALWAYPGQDWQAEFLAQWGKENKVAELADLAD